MATNRIPFSSCLLPLFLTVFLRLPLPVPAKGYIHHICPTSYANGTFATNLRLLLDSLVSNSTLSGASFYTSIGNLPDKAYGRILCRGDTSGNACSNCTGEASREAASLCSGKRVAILWEDECQLQFSDTDISPSSGTDPDLIYSMNNPENVAGADQFKAALEDLMRNLTNAAAYDSWLERFATGQAQFSSSSSIYGMVQCVRDMSDALCKKCLEEAVRQIPSCCDGKKGGRVLGPFCNLRFEIVPFYGASTIAAPAPPTVPTATTNGTTPVPGEFICFVCYFVWTFLPIALYVH